MSDKNQARPELALSEQERKLILMIREMKYGEIHIYVAEGRPVRAEEIKKSVKL